MLVRSGVPSVAEHNAREAGVKLNSCAIALTEPQSSAASWTLKVEAILFDRAATRELGRVETITPLVTQTPSRVVAIATCPGCRGFRVTVELTEQVAGEHECEIELGELPDLHAAAGLVAIEPHAIIYGERYYYLAAALAAGATVVAVPRNVRIWTATGWALAAGGTMSVGGGPAIPIPAATAVQIAPGGKLRGPLNVTFAGIPAAGGGYIIELSQ